jgi:hypothetical protein
VAINFSGGEKIWKQQICFYFQIAYKSLGVPSPYAKLSRGTMWGWFTNNGVLKENYIWAT